jgi:hypothetical protein
MPYRHDVLWCRLAPDHDRPRHCTYAYNSVFKERAEGSSRLDSKINPPAMRRPQAPRRHGDGWPRMARRPRSYSERSCLNPARLSAPNRDIHPTTSHPEVPSSSAILLPRGIHRVTPTMKEGSFEILRARGIAEDSTFRRPRLSATGPLN